jgi:hypothetical protein
MNSVKGPFSRSLAVGHFVVFLPFGTFGGGKCIGCDNLVGGTLMNGTTCGWDLCWVCRYKDGTFHSGTFKRNDVKLNDILYVYHKNKNWNQKILFPMIHR